MDVTPDASPIIGRTPYRNLYLNCGWGTGGFKAVPGAGFAYAHTIATDEPHELNRGFGLDRFVSGALIDDFAFGASGTIYATTHGDDVFRILPNLTTQIVAGLADGVEGNTAIVFGGTALDDEAIYVSTDGGLFVNNGNVNQSGPARTVRIPVGEAEG